MGLLDGKRLLITGVLTDASLAFGVPKLAQEEGAEVVLTGAGRGMRLTQRTSRKLPTEADVLELDVTDDTHPAAVRDALAERWGTVDGALHAIGFAPETCLGGQFLDTTWADVSVAVQVSAYSLRAVADAVVPLLSGGGSIVGLDFDARVAWPAYDWMGVAKAALLTWSDEVYRICGHEPRSFTPFFRTDYVAATPVEDRPKLGEALAQVLATGAAQRLEHRLVRPDGDERTVEVRAQVLRTDATGRITKLTGVVQDVSERKQIERELIPDKEAAEAASQAKSAFLANMSHEIRTPMNAIIGFTNLLLREVTVPGQQERFKKIAHSAEHLLSILNDGFKYLSG